MQETDKARMFLYIHRNRPYRTDFVENHRNRLVCHQQLFALSRTLPRKAQYDHRAANRNLAICLSRTIQREDRETKSCRGFGEVRVCIGAIALFADDIY